MINKNKQQYKNILNIIDQGYTINDSFMNTDCLSLLTVNKVSSSYFFQTHLFGNFSIIYVLVAFR